HGCGTREARAHARARRDARLAPRVEARVVDLERVEGGREVVEGEVLRGAFDALREQRFGARSEQADVRRLGARNRVVREVRDRDDDAARVVGPVVDEVDAPRLARYHAETDGRRVVAHLRAQLELDRPRPDVVGAERGRVRVRFPGGIALVAPVTGRI